MTQTVLRNNEIRLPFLGAKINFIGGLDPLGLQNASEQAYSRLLPGLNNVTGLIRSYSFYPWLLSQYPKSIVSTDPSKQKQFIRRAEFLNALISQSNGIQGINGGTLAAKFLEEENNSFDLQKGIYNSNGSTVDTYWKYPFGIFGQYYLGSIRQIGIIEEVVDSNNILLGLYRPTKQTDHSIVSGDSLAKAFESNISDSNRLLYLKCIESGIVNRNNLKQLKDDFNLREIDQTTEEWNLLTKLLISTDTPLIYGEEPKNRRKETIFHLMNFASDTNREINDREFTMWAYDSKGLINENEDECLSGWYYYQLNEYWQLACTAILHASIEKLQDLAGTGWYPFYELIEIISSEITLSLKENGLIESENDEVIQILDKVNSSEKNLYLEIMNTLGIQRSNSSFKLLFKLLKENTINAERLRQYVSENQYDLSKDVLSFIEEFQLTENLSIRPFLNDFLIENIFFRHKHIAYRKMGLGNQSTEKFILEEGMIRMIDLFGPGFTGPRVGNLITYLKDLQLLSPEGKISKVGIDFLEKLKYDI